ncbi:hypothetical protein Dcar01_02394 [Deinococcus carri]|uniref:Uncharacterized protein n=1 Tax=Deinococcus carri TaxID=1211323 RepID=A0ABP9WB07_9DEIO
MHAVRLYRVTAAADANAHTRSIAEVLTSQAHLHVYLGATGAEALGNLKAALAELHAFQHIQGGWEVEYSAGMLERHNRFTGTLLLSTAYRFTLPLPSGVAMEA